MHDPHSKDSNAELIEALIALAARYGAHDPPPSVDDARMIADGIASELHLGELNHEALRKAATRLASATEDDAELQPKETGVDDGALHGFPTEEPTLARPLHKRRLWGVAACATAAALVVGISPTVWERVHSLDCGTAVHDARLSEAVQICRRDYTRTSAPGIGVKYASLLVETNALEDAEMLANRLVSTSAESDAYQVLGKIYFRQRRWSEAHSHLGKARELHVKERRFGEVAADDFALSAIFRKEERFPDALRALDGCVDGARQSRDRTLEGECYLASATMLRELGLFTAGQLALDRAKPLLTEILSLARVALVQGQLASTHRSHYKQAVVSFERAIFYATASSATEIRREAELDLGDALAELGDNEQATKHLELARQLDLAGEDRGRRTRIAARIAFRKHDLIRATSLNLTAYELLSDDLQRLQVCITQAEIGLESHNFIETIKWAKQAIALSDSTLAKSGLLESHSSMPALRQRAHELLFLALVRTNQFDSAVSTLDRWQSETLLEALARAEPGPSSLLRDAAVRTESLHRLLPELAQNPTLSPIESSALAANLRSVDLIALVIADMRIWRVEIRHGLILISDVGELSTLQPLLDELAVNPTKAALGEALGQRLLGDGAFQPTTETLFVLLAGDLGRLPIVALRDHDQTLVSMRQIVRVTRLAAVGCVPARHEVKRAVVLGDARDDLPEARREAIDVAATLGVTSLLGRAATRAALLASMQGDLLHVAIHTGVNLGGGTFDLADDSVSAVDILAERRGAPSLVVTSADASFAPAFLASGASQVIVALRPVTDVGAHQFASEFYRRGGVEDPVRALAATQRALALTNNSDWPNFAVFGHDTCRSN